MRAIYVILLAPAALLLSQFALSFPAAAGGSQAGRQTTPARDRAIAINVIATREDAPNQRVTANQISLYDDGIEHQIQNLSPDPGPARIVLLADNSRSLRLNSDKMASILREFAYEIYEGDQVMIAGYDEKAELLTEWTDDAKKIEASLKGLRKQGEPHLFDALSAVMGQALNQLTGAVSKRVIVIIGDGLDRGSRTRFSEILTELQLQDVAVYAFQVADRTGGALRRDQPKPSQVIQQITEGTGGRVLSINEPREGVKSICDELRNNRYMLYYTPTQVSYTDSRRLLIVPTDGVTVRYKLMQPPRARRGS